MDAGSYNSEVEPKHPGRFTSTVNRAWALGQGVEFVALSISPLGGVNATSKYLTGSVPSGDGTTGYVPDLVKYNKL